MIRIKIPFKTPTVNHLYYHQGNIKILTKEARDIQKQIKDLIEALKINCTPYLDERLSIKILIHEDWYTKKCEVKKKDIANREKFLVDSVFEVLGLNDKFIFEHQMYKVQDKEEYAIIEIKTLGSKYNREVNKWEA